MSMPYLPLLLPLPVPPPVARLEVGPDHVAIGDHGELPGRLPEEQRVAAAPVRLHARPALGEGLRGLEVVGLAGEAPISAPCFLEVMVELSRGRTAAAGWAGRSVQRRGGGPPCGRDRPACSVPRGLCVAGGDAEEEGGVPRRAARRRSGVIKEQP